MGPSYGGGRPLSTRFDNGLVTAAGRPRPARRHRIYGHVGRNMVIWADMWPFDRNGTFVPLCPTNKVNFSRAENLPHKIFPRARACACVLASRSATRHRCCGGHSTSLRQPGQPVTRATAPRSPRPRGHRSAPPARCRRRFGESGVASSSLPPLVPRARGCRFGGRSRSHSHTLRRLDPPVPRARGSRSEDSGWLFWRSFRGLSSAVLATVLKTFLAFRGALPPRFRKIVPHMAG